MPVELDSELDRLEVARQSDLAVVQESVDAITADPANAVTAIWIPAQALQLMQGTATLDKASARLPCWLMPDGASNYLATAIQLPSHWNTINVSFYLTNVSANAGAVSMSAEVHNWAVGDSINVAPAGSTRVESLPTTAWVSHKITTTTPITVDPSKTTTVRIGRNGASGSDTLPNNAALLGVRLEKVS